jgi:hypothetical protein
MKQITLTLFFLLAMIGNATAAILVLSPNGVYTTKTTLAAAATAADAAGKTVLVTSPQIITTAIPWPTDRVLKFTKGGYITFSSSGSLTGLSESEPEHFGGDATYSAAVNTTAMNLAINALRSGGVFTVPQGNTYDVNTIYLKSNITFLLNGTLRNVTDVSLAIPDSANIYSGSAYNGNLSAYSTLYLKSLVNVTIKGNGKIVTPRYEGVYVWGSDYVNISGIIIEGSSSNALAFHGIFAYSTGTNTNLSISDTEIRNIGRTKLVYSDAVLGCGIMVAGYHYVFESNNYIHDIGASGIYNINIFNAKTVHNTILNCGIDGIFTNKSEYTIKPSQFLISDNTIENIGADGIDCTFYSVPTGSRQIAKGIITNNIVSNTGNITGTNPDGGLLTLIHLDDVVVTGNVFRNAVRRFIYAYDSQNVIIANNKIYDAVGFAYFGLCKYITVSDNIVSGITSALFTFGSESPQYLKVSNNSFLMSDSGGYVIVPELSVGINNLVFSGNDIQNSVTNTGPGMFISISECKITGNTFGTNIIFSSIAGSTSVFKDNIVKETILFTSLVNSVITDNIFDKSAYISAASKLVFNGNVVNASNTAGNLLSIYGAVDRITVIGNILNAQSGTNGVYSTAINSVFANTYPSGTKDITGAGTVVLY